jgi:hypothetical protein
MRVGTILQFIGGRLVGVALSGVIIGIFVLVVGATPAQFIASFFQHSPTWLISPWFSPSFTIFGIFLIVASLWFNIWSRKQKAIDELAEDISFAIDDLVNRTPRPQTDGDIEKWKKDYEAWCDKVNKKLENRAFFTRADQLHFDRLGFIDPLFMTGHPRLDELLGQLRLKFDRLRDVINSTQQRRR